jgi:hypothetical protein
MKLHTEDEIKKIYNCKTKLTIINTIINIYCAKSYLNHNLWMLLQISDILKEIEANTRKSQEIVLLLCKLVSIIKLNKSSTIEIEKEDLQTLLFYTYSVSSNIGFIKELVDDTTYNYLGILHDNLRDGKNLNQSLGIVQKIIETSTSRELDGYDCMFLFLLNIIDILEFRSSIKKYINICKDIFYYRLKKKDRPLRVNLIYYSIIILISKKISNKQLVGNKNNDYLNITPLIDNDCIHEMNFLREQNKNNIVYKKIHVHNHNHNHNYNENMGILNLEVLKK